MLRLGIESEGDGTNGIGDRLKGGFTIEAGIQKPVKHKKATEPGMPWSFYAIVDNYSITGGAGPQPGDHSRIALGPMALRPSVSRGLPTFQLKPAAPPEN